MADTLVGSNCVAAIGMVVTGFFVALVDVIVTVSALKAVPTFGASVCLVTYSVTVTTVAVTKTILAPRATGAGCIKGGEHTYVLVYADVMS